MCDLWQFYKCFQVFFYVLYWLKHGHVGQPWEKIPVQCVTYPKARSRVRDFF